MATYMYINDFRIHEKLVVHCQDAKAAVFGQLCDKFLHCTAFESTEQTHVSSMLIHKHCLLL